MCSPTHNKSIKIKGWWFGVTMVLEHGIRPHIGYFGYRKRKIGLFSYFDLYWPSFVCPILYRFFFFQSAPGVKLNISVEIHRSAKEPNRELIFTVCQERSARPQFNRNQNSPPGAPAHRSEFVGTESTGTPVPPNALGEASYLSRKVIHVQRPG